MVKNIIFLLFYLFFFSCIEKNENKYICEIKHKNLILPGTEIIVKFNYDYSDIKMGEYLAILESSIRFYHKDLNFIRYTLNINGKIIEINHEDILFLKD